MDTAYRHQLKIARHGATMNSTKESKQLIIHALDYLTKNQLAEDTEYKAAVLIACELVKICSIQQLSKAIATAENKQIIKQVFG